ncbi:hypothetical protein [Dethiothermospora halolimnae]|uniref:hypothetical protein n=1 Tax=Dethiothermospora halolimnae TaxID=3114390 RepID=UPI003CCB7613
MKNKKVVVLFLAVVTMLMVVGNVAFATHVFYEERPEGGQTCKYKITCTSYDEEDCTETKLYCWD